MQDGVNRPLYDGPVSARDLRGLKPHASCHGRGCGKIVLREEGSEEWHIARGKPYCGCCFGKRRTT